ncbi:MAG: hypothetical protein M3Q26_12915 [Acidobacteriota bacterium]|nr:hypothetical protein [Acidobacteriota bacterium]
MTEEKLIFQPVFDREFCFESYGVRIRIESDRQELLEEAESVIRKALLNRIEIIDSKKVSPEHSFGIGSDENGILYLYQDGKYNSHTEVKWGFFKYFNSLLRIVVAEHAVGKVFIHAGTVGWNGKAIIIPANSFKGKTSLVAELVKNGAEYYSDEYAVLDENGLVHPFARDLSIRPDDGSFKESDTPVESIGGIAGSDPLPVGMVLLTEFKAGAKWKPQILTTGEGIIEVLPHTVPIRFNPEFSLKVLQTMATGAIIVKSPRDDAKQFAKLLLNFFDNRNN